VTSSKSRALSQTQARQRPRATRERSATDISRWQTEQTNIGSFGDVVADVSGVAGAGRGERLRRQIDEPLPPRMTTIYLCRTAFEQT
jgi:hypothetical protein